MAVGSPCADPVPQAPVGDVSRKYSESKYAHEAINRHATAIFSAKVGACHVLLLCAAHLAPVSAVGS